MLNPAIVKLKNGLELRLVESLGATGATNTLKYVLFNDDTNLRYVPIDLNEYLNTDSTKDFSKTYFEKKSVIPRSKFREYGKSKNWKIVRNYDTATSIIIPDDYLMLQNFWDSDRTMYLSADLFNDFLDPSSDFRIFIKNNCSFIHSYISDTFIRNLSTQSKNEKAIKNIVFQLNYNEANKFRLEREKLISSKQFEVFRRPIKAISADNICHLVNYKDKLVYDGDLALNLGDTIIGKSEFESIEAMIKSGLSEDINLAVSLVTQCNYDKSLLYLALFLFKYNNVIYNHPTYNLKDYKSLRKHFSKYGDVKRWTIHTFSKMVKDNSHLIDDDFFSIMNKVLHEYVLSRITGMESYINFDNITFNYD